MKKILILLALMATLLISFNCESDGDDASNSDTEEPVLVSSDCLIGTWSKNEEGDGTSVTVLEFADDDSLVRTTARTKNENTNYNYEKGTWALNGNTLEIIIKTSGESTTSAADALNTANINDEADWRKSENTVACKDKLYTDEPFTGGNTTTLVGEWTSSSSKSYKMSEGAWKLSRDRSGSLKVISGGTATYTSSEKDYYDESNSTWIDDPTAVKEENLFSSWTYKDDTLTLTMDQAEMVMDVLVIENYIGLGGYKKQ